MTGLMREKDEQEGDGERQAGQHVKISMSYQNIAVEYPVNSERTPVIKTFGKRISEGGRGQETEKQERAVNNGSSKPRGLSTVSCNRVRTLRGSENRDVCVLGAWETHRILERLQLFAGFKSHSFARWNRDFCAGPGVASDSRLSRTYVEDSEPSQLDSVPLCKCSFHGVEYGFYGLLRVCLGNPGAVHNLVDDI